MARPVVVGVSSYARYGSPLVFAVPCGYIDALRAAGVIPLVLPAGEPQPERLLDVIDGLILSGGGDISPGSYGAEPHETVYSVCEERDAFEFALARAALQRHDLPLLCICRGMQVLNVACGGTLHVHLPDRFGEQVNHRLPPRKPTRHAVRVAPQSRLAKMLAATEVDVCSWHHQAPDKIGRDLRAVAWAEDQVVEAVEHQSHPWCFGVQWHPEMQADEPPSQGLFGAFVAAVRGRPRDSAPERIGAAEPAGRRGRGSGAGGR